jgi:fatty-acyl-CoA synthase
MCAQYKGYITIEGRLKDLIIRGGENISPKEVEDFLYTHKSVQDVEVIGVPDEKYGEEICAWIILRDADGDGDGQEENLPTEEAIREFCKGQISHYKVPRYVRFVKEFPFTISGKVKKFEIRNAMIEELGLHEIAK